MKDIHLILRATDFAAKKHRSQKRKGSRDEPYVNHVIDVALRLAEVDADINTIVAGLLHDTVEDTETTIDDIIKHFGSDVANIVAEVTDDKSLPKAERKQLQIDNTSKKSPAAKRVKLADKSSNLSDIVVNPPVGWDRDRLKKYVLWSALVIDEARGVDPQLEATFDEIYKTAFDEYCG